MTYLDIQTRVNRRVIDLPATVQAEVPDLINDAIRSAQRKYNFKAMEKSVTFITTEGSKALGTIARFKEYRDKGPYLLQKLTNAKILPTAPGSDEDLITLNNTDFPGAPEILLYSLDGTSSVQTYTIAPYANGSSDWDDGDYRIVVPYYEYTTKLVNSGDTNWFVDNMEDYIIQQATGKAFALDWDYDSMALWLQQADVAFQEARKADKTMRLAGVNELVPMYKGAFQSQVRR